MRNAQHIKLIGNFDLKSETNVSKFSKAFERFAKHLNHMELVENWSFYNRQPHQGYDSQPPTQKYMIEIGFNNSIQAQACYDYVEEDEEPLRSLHKAMNRQITNPTFALYNHGS